jgi:hypothetical protein
MEMIPRLTMGVLLNCYVRILKHIFIDERTGF